ncbi:hypothetical protein ASPBRDRAFT_206103 [Aspergillus brasiliensis CBS 101740]|uniref:Uncharacterized protein n=1 Tax=Aspergillus brasiliensis (strain CBS 101740 / IMI 381727 / IBT 21946) TaxID=767769 RepID=A0A1L9UQA5_ASPBC|nr:hypothetical protein ASPBRDRAFT_206103 [Aspergillus brasiliensis CBS 101740]
MGKRKQVKASSSETSSKTLDALQAKVDEMSRDLREKWWLAASGGHGWEKPAINYDEAFPSLFCRTKHWADKYVKRDTAALAEYSPKEKQSILQSLNGYCVQDLDWDTFIESLPYPICTSVPLALAQTMIVKDIIDKFFESPFWYFEGKPDLVGMEPRTEHSLSFAQHLQHLYEQFLIVNPKSASLWKAETVRLANSTNDDQANNTELGLRTKRRREEAARSFASAMLEHPPFQMLLGACEDTADREASLVEYYEDAEKLAFGLGYSHGICSYRNLTRLPRSSFWRGDPFVTAEYLHGLRPDQPRLDGHRILFIMQPAVSRIGAFPEGELQEWTQAVAVIEDGQWTKEECEKSRKEQKAKDEEAYRRKKEEGAKMDAIYGKAEREWKEQYEEQQREAENAPVRQHNEKDSEELENTTSKRARGTRRTTRKKAVQQEAATEDEPPEEKVEAKKRGRRANRKTTK